MRSPCAVLGTHQQVQVAQQVYDLLEMHAIEVEKSIDDLEADLRVTGQLDNLDYSGFMPLDRSGARTPRLEEGTSWAPLLPPTPIETAAAPLPAIILKRTTTAMPPPPPPNASSSLKRQREEGGSDEPAVAPRRAPSTIRLKAPSAQPSGSNDAPTASNRSIATDSSAEAPSVNPNRKNVRTSRVTRCSFRLSVVSSQIQLLLPVVPQEGDVQRIPGTEVRETDSMS